MRGAKDCGAILDAKVAVVLSDQCTRDDGARRKVERESGRCSHKTGPRSCQLPAVLMPCGDSGRRQQHAWQSGG
jgi:hypothetical protein